MPQHVPFLKDLSVGGGEYFITAGETGKDIRCWHLMTKI